MSNLAARAHPLPNESEDAEREVDAPPPAATPAVAFSDDELDILTFRIEEFRARDEMQRCFMSGAPILADS